MFCAPLPRGGGFAMSELTRPVFGDPASAEKMRQARRSYFSDPLGVVQEKERQRLGIMADDALMAAMAAKAERPAVAVQRKRRVRRARINTIAPSEYNGRFRVVHHSIDSYAANVKGGEVRSDCMTLLAMTQEEAKALTPPAPVASPLPPFLGTELAIKPHGGGTYAYLLQNDDVQVKVRKADHAPTLAPATVELSSACLHREGYVRALRALAAWVKLWAPHTHLQPSEVDLCADTQGWQPDLTDFQARAFVCPCPEVDLRYSAAGLNYVRYGKGGKSSSRSGPSPMQCAMYDKSEEIRKSDKGWFIPLWAVSPDYDPEEAVWRIEYRFRREWLKTHDIETQEKLLLSLALLWYAGLEWCRYSIPAEEGEDGNRSRWKVRPEWRVLLNLVWDGAREGALTRLDQARPKLERTLAAIGGHMVTLNALFGGVLDWDLDGIAELALPAIKKRWEVRGEDYQVKVEARMLRLGGVAAYA